MKRKPGAVATVPDLNPAPGVAPLNSLADQQEIASLAYLYWQARGCPVGSPEEDWYRAEQALREQVRRATA